MAALTALRTAWTTVSHAAAFFGRHYPVVFAFGGAASIQRVISVLYGDELPTAANVTGEIFTAAVRLAFVVWLVRTLITRDDGLSRRAGPRLWAFCRLQWPVVVGHLVLLTAAALIFNNLLEGAGAALVSEDQLPTFWAWLLAVKNVTIIPFTLVWLVVMVRDALRMTPLTTEGQTASGSVLRTR